MTESNVPYCSTCGELVGFVLVGDGKEVFVACHGCGYPLCKPCWEDELRVGRTSCARCEEPYRHVLVKTHEGPDDLEEAAAIEDHTSMYKENRLHRGSTSSFFAVGSEIKRIWESSLEGQSAILERQEEEYKESSQKS